MKQSDWPKFQCDVCRQTVSVISAKYPPTCEHKGTPREAHKMTVMKEVEK